MALRIGLDIDGCLYPWTRAVNDAVEEKFGFMGLAFEHTHWNYLQEELSDYQWKWCWGREAAPKVFGRTELIYPNAINAVQRMCNEHEVHFVTHRNPALTSGITSDWLASKFTNYRGVHVLDNSVSKVGVMDWDVFVDDKPDTIAEFADAHVRIMVPDRPWNEGTPGEHFACWREVPERL